MKPRFSLLAVLMLTVTLALVGVLRDVNTGKALIPDPLQPFLANATGGMADTKLGNPALVNNYTITSIPRGSRTTLPWIYSGPGWELDVDKGLADGAPLGTVFSYVDALCDSVNVDDSDILEQLPCSGMGEIHPLIWNESTTAVEGTGSEFLKSLVPPYSWLTRHTANITNICLYGTTPKPTTSILNTVYTNVPFSANGSAFTATTKLGGDPTLPPNDTCLDSPQSSTSITTLYHAPALEGDSDGPCDTGTYACADGAIYGMWTDSLVTSSKTITVEKVKLNNGPEDGTFSEHWEIEVTEPGVVAATWDQTGTATIDETVELVVSDPTEQEKDLDITCLDTGWSLVVLKNVLWPAMDVASAQMTKDTYADDNAFVFVVKVICGDGEADILVDKEVIWIKPVEVSGLTPASPDLESTPDHLQLDLGQAITVKIDELKANHHTTPVIGHEFLVAEVADLVKLGVEWDTGSVTIDQGGAPTPVAPVGTCTTGDACIHYVVEEPQGQSDVKADLTITCGAVPGLYSVVLKAIDAPAPPWGEAKPSDNAQRSVIKVWCGVAAMDPDGIEDANGLYARWTVFQSLGTSSLQIAAELRKSYKNPPSIASDTGYVERIVDLQCFWMDDDGCPTCNADSNNYIDEVESWNDPDLVALGGINALDEDRDCLMNAALAQPSHPVDELDEPTGTNCATGDGWVVYSEAPNVVLHDKAADQDCDGLVDGIEKAWGSNPQMADSDSDGAPDFVEIFQQTNPLNPDTDGDGLKDRPEDDYIASAAGGAAEPGQEYGSACDDNLDNDADGKFNDGCLKVSAVEAVCNEIACPDANGKAPWDTCDNDSDGYINDGCAAVAEGANEDDNCPGVANADQANNDAKRRPNGVVLGNGLASNPNQDKMGDACDTDDDNDFLPDTNEGPAGSDPFKIDSDGDTVADGAEVIYKTDPMVGGANKPAWTAAIQQKYFRGCHHNLPAAGTYGGYTNWDAEYDAPPPPYIAGSNDVEMDADGDGILCGTTDKDSDNGTGTGAAAPVEIEDSVEAFGYGTQIANKDTDGDGCADWIEMVDLNGSRQANIADVLDFNRRAYDIYAPSDSDVLFDLNRSGSINVADALLAARNSSLLKPHAICSSEG